MSNGVWLKVFNAALKRGEDHGSAAYLATEAEQRIKRAERSEAEHNAEAARLLRELFILEVDDVVMDARNLGDPRICEWLKRDGEMK